jgi:acid phosphatase
MRVARHGLTLAVLAPLAVVLVAAGATRSDADSVCGNTVSPPRTYKHVVVIMEENRTWPRVGGPGFNAMPYTRNLAQDCSFYTNWLETNPQQNSLTQYIGLTSGVDNPATFNDCFPSACHSTDNNIFRQVRRAGGTARTYVEGATRGCDGARHLANVPALYYFGAHDHSFCRKEVRPLTELDVKRLPTFAMIIPSLCHNGHDCSNASVDAWLKAHLSKILASRSYRSRSTAVFVIYDEDRPVPNLLLAPTAHAGAIVTTVASHSAALHTIEDMLGLPVLPSVKGAPSLRASAHV